MYKINDVHIHLGPSGPWKPDFNPSTNIKQVMEFKKKNNINKCVVFPNPAVATKYHELNDYVIKAVKEFPREFIPFGRIDPRDKKWAKIEVERLAKSMVAGIKLHPAVECFRPDHPYFFDIYEQIIAYDMLIISHSSDVGFARADHWKPVCERFQNLKLILAHINRDSLSLSRNYQHVYVDTSATLNTLNKLNDFKIELTESDSEKILIGSDFPYVDDLSQQIKIMEALNMSQFCIENILFRNFDRFFKH